MPTYEYACSACANEWDQVQRITEAPIEVCPKCGKSEAHRLISRGTNFILKGGGWYSDLYSSSKPPAKTESSAPAESAATGEAKSDGKAAPAAPAAAAPSTSATPSSTAPSTTTSSTSS